MKNPIIKILLIEDDPQDIDYIRELLCDISTDLPTLTTAPDLTKGLTLIRDNHFDVILLDLFLPDSKGLDTLSRIINITTKIPVIILTALNNEDLAMKAVKQGAQDYIFKWGIDNQGLIRSIQYSIERNKLRLEIEKVCETRFHQIIEKIGDAIVVIDKKGFILFVNSEAVKLFNMTWDEIVGEMFGYPIVEGELSEISIVNKTGDIIITEMRVTEIEWAGENVYLATLRDITERRRAEKLLSQAEKLTSIGQLAASVAHEVNNPLTNISIILHTIKNKLLKKEETGVEIANKIELIKKNVDRASGIIKELLHFSREKSRNFTPLNLNDVIESSLILMDHYLKDIALSRSLTTDVEVMGDYIKLEQVFINILKNSIEAMAGKGAISLSSRMENTTVIIDISDTGSGIPDNLMVNIFDPFFTTKDSFTSAGIGLSICYGIINEHNGKLEIASSHGKGTTVTIKLPQYKE